MNSVCISGRNQGEPHCIRNQIFSGMDGEVYCKHCYAVKFGHKQKSDYKAWMDCQAIPGESGEKDTCPRCSGKVIN